MKLYILRHGQAENFATSDRTRNLTEYGRWEVDTTACGAISDLKTIERILVSPYNRAQQTAAIVAEHLSAIGCHVESETTDLLVPEANPQALCDYVQSLSLSSVLLVSHQPLVGTLVDSLCGLMPGCYGMSTSALASIETEIVATDLGELNWLRHPQDW